MASLRRYNFKFFLWKEIYFQHHLPLRQPCLNSSLALPWMMQRPPNRSSCHRSCLLAKIYQNNLSTAHMHLLWFPFIDKIIAELTCVALRLFVGFWSNCYSDPFTIWLPPSWSALHVLPVTCDFPSLFLYSSHSCCWNNILPLSAEILPISSEQ